MTKEEFMAMPANEAAEKLNELVKAGKSKDEAMAEFGVAQPDLMKAQIFWVKDEFSSFAHRGSPNPGDPFFFTCHKHGSVGFNLLVSLCAIDEAG